MKPFISAKHGNRFKLINLDNIAYVDFVSLDENPDTPERCTIYFVSQEKGLSLDNPADTRALLNALKGNQQ
jgi:hypothetical protein